ncbi:putative protein phosphatase 2C 66 [Acorus gramineus]|uniref:protein-serine/threonine phosphatase n=1 Tax=Acorus gramineus TaxID=55184 RepID=A0AAV9BCD8_ACOGR|nr:putative protein phosphatase 2C 66 [Acorus gramineus]
MGSCLSSHTDSLGCSSPTAGNGSRWWRRKSDGVVRGGVWAGIGGGGGRGGGGGGGVVGEDELHRVPGRMFVNGSSEVACLFTQQGRKGTNQDAMLVWEDFTSKSDTVFCGVFDGHGPYGHMVARKVRDCLPLKLSIQWSANMTDLNSPYQNGSMNSEETASISMEEEWGEPLDADENEKLPEMFLTLKQSMLKTFKWMDKELKMNPAIDCFCSGSTAVTLIKQGQDLVIGNVGDSRAVLGTRDKDNSLVAVQLTVDLKPDLPREAARIQQCKGRVFALQDEPEVARVWLPNNDSPGLAMARAFGDFCLKDFGLISVPDISYRHLTEKDEFVVLATDGVWDVLSNKEVVDIVTSAPSRATAARALVDCAVRAWRLKYPTSKSDDCAVVCLFLNPPTVSSHAVETLSETPKDPAETVTERPVSDPLQSHDDEEIVPATEPRAEKLEERCQSTRSLAECISTKEEEEWSALEGVTRVNSLLNLPRFLSSDKKSSGSRRKWL